MQLSDEDIARIPRYQFGRTGVGCGTPGHNAACLCDVRLPDRPTAIMAEAPMFARFALGVLDDTRVSARNFREFASIMLGCHDKYVTLGQPFMDADGDIMIEYPNGEVRAMDEAYSEGNSPWSQLPRDTIDRLVESYKALDPWDESMVPEWVPEFDRAYVRRLYGQRLCQHRQRQRDALPERIAA